MGMTFAALMARAGDEPDAMYGLAAKSVAISPDELVYRFTLRPEAKFHDGQKLTARDAAFSLNILKTKGHPIITQQVRDMLKAEAADDATLVVTFAAKRGRDVPLFVAGLPIFSQAYYTTRPFDESTLDIPLGSGPYKVSKFEVNRFIEFDRVKDWWGADLPVNRGSYNFGTVRFDFYRDRDVAFEGFTGRSYLFREEFTSRIRNTRYDFPAITDGRVKRELLPDETPSGAQGWFINSRREKFRDPRVREALGNAFDFEWTNKTIMYGAYVRTHSPFQNSDMMAIGPPSPEEVALLEPFRGKVPDEVFGQPFMPPVSDGSGQDRTLLRKAVQLLQDAGYVMKDGKRMTPQGEAFRIEFLLDEPAFQAHHMPFIKNLGTLGIEAMLRLVDPVQFRARRDDFDFDMIIERFGFSTVPGDSLRPYFSSWAAATKGSNNLAGISDPAIDAMVEQMIAADTRPILLMVPTLLGILFVSFIVVQFAPGGPVERVIAQLSGADTGASSRISGSSGGDFGARNQVGAASDAVNSKYRGAQGLDPEFVKSLEKQFGFDKPAPYRFALMLWNFARFDFGKSYFRDVSVLQLIKEKLPVSISLGIWMTLLTYLISIPLGIRKAVMDGSRFDP